jgi:hypothetical protein
MLVKGNTVSGGDNFNGDSKPLEDFKLQSIYESLGWSFGNDSAHP